MDKSSSSKSFLSVQAIVLAEIAWAVFALLFFLLFSVPLPGQGRPVWYSIGTSIFEVVAYFAAALLCFRNWRSPQIVSGRNVWLSIGLGMLCYFVGGLLFTYWETGLGRDAAVSPGDFFYVLTYILLIIGMFLAVAARRLNLEIWQWGIVAAITGIGVLFAWLISSSPALPSGSSLLVQPAIAQTAPATKPSPTRSPAAPAKRQAAPAKPSPTPAASTPAASPTPAIGQPLAPPPAVDQTTPLSTAQQPPAPEWAVAVEELLKPLEVPLGWFYVVIDVLLLIIATTLLLAFWGGRFAQSWRMIAAAAFSLYIADMWFKYATTRLPDYQSGGLLEVFWVFSGVLFGIGAALEHDLSSRSRSRAGGRRRSA
nr:hypothetical protein [Leptolyngbya sp. FACHB-36]